MPSGNSDRTPEEGKYWHEKHGSKEEAVNYAIAAHDWQKTLDLVNAINPLFTFGGRTTYNWLRQIPQEILLTNLQSGIMFAAALVFIGQNIYASTFLDTLERINSRDTVLMAGGAFLRTIIAAFQNDPRIEDYARKTLSLLPPDDSTIDLLFLSIWVSTTCLTSV